MIPTFKDFKVFHLSDRLSILSDSGSSRKSWLTFTSILAATMFWLGFGLGLELAERPWGELGAEVGGELGAEVPTLAVGA